MNRVTRLLHKARFLSRHRYLLAYSHKYVITADDIARAPQTASADSKSEQEEPVRMIEDLLRDFDVESNETDRRIYYEVMGRNMGSDEFDYRDSSDEDWGML